MEASNAAYMPRGMDSPHHDEPHEPLTEKCPNCGHWMRWSDRLDLFKCMWCKTKLSVADRSVGK